MDKILSARVDERVANRITLLARKLKTSKKRIIEAAVDSYAAQVEEGRDLDVFRETCGAWHREDPPSETVEKARKAFEGSMQRHQT